MKIKYHVVIFTCALLIIISCKPLHLNRFPGEKITDFPMEFRGEYQPSKSNNRLLFLGKKNPKDTDMVHITTNVITIKQKDETKRFVLDSNCVLSKIGDEYYVSVNDPVNKKIWYSSYFKLQQNKKLLVYLFYESSPFEYGKYLETAERFVNDGDTLSLYKVNDSTFNSFVKDYCKQFSPIHLRKTGNP
ncbi:MAG: hypothetical protein MUC81_07470 [Bacteroidia bacterium]|nr:hypothetical protein [Bacteroidia bacterium]